jgi:hypothetical protein
MGIQLQSRKGQSAIEYLTTYGWMLLVVAIVGAAIFTTIGNTDGAQAAPEGFEQVSIDNVEVNTEDDLVMSFTNVGGSETIDIHNVTMSADGNTAYNDTGISLPSTESGSLKLTDVNESDTTNTFDVEFIYSQGSDSNFSDDGTIEGEYQIITN